MKKLLILIAVFAGFTASAQELTSKKGTPIRPEVGDYWIGINAVPFLEYVGNLFVTGDNSAPNFGFTATNPGIITGGKVIDANTSYRAKLRIGFGTQTTNFVVENDATTDPADVSFDERKISGNNIAIGLGIQKNRGNGRLRGLYGAEAFIGFSGTKTTHNFANAYSAANPIPDIADSLDFLGGSSNGRVTEVKSGSTFSLGLNGFVGVEYFFAPKMSFSGEFTWGLRLDSTGEGNVTTESFDGTSVTSTESPSGKKSNFSIDTGNAQGAINFNFYF